MAALDATNADVVSNFFLGSTPSMTNTASLYERGDALEEILTDQSAPFAAEDVAVSAQDYNLSNEQYWEWLESLIEQGSELDHYLDEVLDQIYDCQPPFYSLSGRRDLKALLDELHTVRGSVRAYESDVEKITYVFARTDALETQAAESADIALSQIKMTYTRAYDLCLYKMDGMSNGWVTATNLLISLTILVVTILFWMEFR